MIDGQTASRDAQLAKLSRALMRPHRTTYLHWQLNGEQPPTWFRLHQQHKSHLDLSRTYSDPSLRSTYVVPVTVLADAFGIGTKVDLPPQTVAAQDLQQGLELPQIMGTVPAPLVLDLLPSHPWGGWQQLVNLTAVNHDAEYSGPRFWPASMFTPKNGAARNGSSIAWDEILGGDPDGNAFATLASAPTKIVPGTYRFLVLARHQGNDKGGGWFKAGVGGHTAFSAESLGPWAPWEPATGSSNDQCWVSGGITTVPGGGMNVETMDDKTFPQPEIQAKFRWNLEDDGYADAYLFDGMILVPAGPIAGMANIPTTFMPRWDKYGPDPNWLGRINSEERRVSMVSTLTGGDANTPGAIPQGGWPYVTPDARNYVTVLNRINPRSVTTGTRLYNYSVVVSGSYRPRFLHTAATQ